MSDWSPFSLVAAVGATILVIGWISIVILKPSPARDLLGWIGATALYLALASWFVGLSLEVWHEQRWALLVAFGFLAFMFSTGLLVSLYRTVLQIAGRSSATQSATN
jgi:hypothetical protein